jgi:GNAT superfamily N-acetyltransferase
LNQLLHIRTKISEVGILYALQTLKWRLVSSRQFDANLWIVVTREIQDLTAVKDHDPAIRWATPDDTPQLIACGIKPEKLKADFGNTLKIAVYKQRGRIIAYGQYAVRSWNQDDWVAFKFDQRDFHGAGIWVAPEYRGQGIAPQIMKFAWSYFAQNGFKRMIAITNTLNRNSFRAAGKVRPAIFNRFWYIRLFGFTYFHYGPFRKIGRWNPCKRIDIPLAHGHPL